jgi:hypothetical protein
VTLEQWLRQLNPLAEVSTTRLAQDTPDWLFRSEVFRGSYEQRFRWLGHVLTTCVFVGAKARWRGASHDRNMRDFA